MPNKIPRWSIEGFSQEQMDASSQALAAFWSDRLESMPTDSGIINPAWALLNDGNLLISMAALGYHPDHPALRDWRSVGEKMVSATICYFYGSWRSSFKYIDTEYDLQSSRIEMPWIDYYRWGLTTALILGDWRSASRILEWPVPELRFDDGVDNRTREDNAFHIWLAMRFRNGCGDTTAEEYAKFSRGTRRRPKLLGAAADAIFAEDSVAFGDALEKYLRHYRKKERRMHLIRDTLCVDANLLFHLARWRGLELPAFADELAVMIMDDSRSDE